MIYFLSRSSACRSRIASRLQVSQQIISEFSQNPPKYVAVHWDGKLSQNRYGESHEAFSIVATGPSNFTNEKFKNLNKPAEKHKQKLPLKC